MITLGVAKKESAHSVSILVFISFIITALRYFAVLVIDLLQNKQGDHKRDRQKRSLTRSTKQNLGIDETA